MVSGSARATPTLGSRAGKAWWLPDAEPSLRPSRRRRASQLHALVPPGPLHLHLSF